MMEFHVWRGVSYLAEELRSLSPAALRQTIYRGCFFFVPSLPQNDKMTLFLNPFRMNDHYIAI